MRTCTGNGKRKEQFRLTSFRRYGQGRCSQNPSRTAKAYADCFPNQGIGIRQNYPYFDEKEGKVITLELALNRCREVNGEPPFSYVKTKWPRSPPIWRSHRAASRSTSKIPDDPRALEAYQNGKRYFYTRRGQLNFSLRDLSRAEPRRTDTRRSARTRAGILNAMPIFVPNGAAWGRISRRFTTCNTQIRGVPLNPQDDEYRDLEYYLSYVSNGLPISGPGARP